MILTRVYHPNVYANDSAVNNLSSTDGLYILTDKHEAVFKNVYDSIEN